jgi:hypothetical protein
MRRLMKKTAPAPVTRDKDLAPPLFKNSLLAWQARWKAQRGAGENTAPRPSAPSRPV